MALEADPLDGRGLILEQPPVVAIDIAFLALPLSDALRARANDDEDALKQVQTVRPCFRTDRGRRIPHVENGPHAFEEEHHTACLIVAARRADVATFREQQGLPWQIFGPPLTAGPTLSRRSRRDRRAPRYRGHRATSAARMDSSRTWRRSRSPRPPAPRARPEAATTREGPRARSPTARGRSPRRRARLASAVRMR